MSAYRHHVGVGAHSRRHALWPLQDEPQVPGRGVADCGQHGDQRRCWRVLEQHAQDMQRPSMDGRAAAMLAPFVDHRCQFLRTSPNAGTVGQTAAMNTRRVPPLALAARAYRHEPLGRRRQVGGDCRRPRELGCLQACDGHV